MIKAKDRGMSFSCLVEISHFGLLYLLEFRFLTNTERVKLVTVCVTVNRFSDSVYASLAINTRKFAGFESLRTFLKKYTRFDLILCFDPQPDNSGR
jgi:hypothetical protein